MELCFVADFEASLKVMEGHVVDTEALVQLEDDPLYVKVPVTVIVHKIFPLDEKIGGTDESGIRNFRL